MDILKSIKFNILLMPSILVGILFADLASPSAFRVKQPNGLTVERLDSSKPHHRTNCVLSCYTCNMRRLDRDNVKKFLATRNVSLKVIGSDGEAKTCLLYTSPSPRDATLSRMPSSA